MNNQVILGLCNATNSSASLIIDNKVIACAAEERFNRIKNFRGIPIKAIEYCLTEGGINKNDVTKIACGAWGGIDEKYLFQYSKEIIEKVQKFPKAKKLIFDRIKVAAERDIFAKEELKKFINSYGFKADISFYDHHLSHAFTAFYPSPFKNALIFTVDGRGDYKSATASQGDRDNGISLLSSVNMLNSLGYFYGYITKFLGFTPDKHEGKVTGLAAYGNPNKCINILRKMINYIDNQIESNIGDYYTPFMTANIPALDNELKSFSKEDISAGTQYLLEEIVIKYVSSFLKNSEEINLCLSGGVFGNVKLNQKLFELEKVKNVYVSPEMGDGGNSFGGALIELYKNGGQINYPLSHTYFGPSYSNEQIINEINCFGNELKYIDINKYGFNKVAKDLNNGKVIGIFSGRMEFGPRALGGRSIIAHGHNININKSINERLNRTEFMPFAPVTLEEKADEYYVGWNKTHIASRFMTTCYNCHPKLSKESPAVVHVDNTARPQIINKKNNPLYYKILHSFYEETGIPTLINTSFNNHEEPIVCSPTDAFRSLLKENVDYIIIENFIVFKA